MATPQAYSCVHISHMSQQWIYPHLFQRAATERVERKVDSGDVVQGRIFWLPSREELPARAVKRAHGKGAVEEGIYQHPVVIVSRPAEDSRVAHFHLVSKLLTQLRGVTDLT